MRPVRVSDEALVDVARQLDPEPAAQFVAYDLGPAVEAMTTAVDWFLLTKPHGPGRRMTIDGITVAGYHLSVALDPVDPRVDALVIYEIDIWAHAWPDETD